MERVTSSGTAWQRARPLFGYAIGAACLVWVFHGVRLNELPRNMLSLGWGWVAAGVFFDILSYLCQGVRWSLLLRPVGKISVLRATQAVYIGLFTNEVIPMRVGEMVRAYLVSRWLSVGLASTVSSLAVERLIDGVWLAVAIGLTGLFVKLPRGVIESGEVLGALVLIGVALFLYLVLRRKKTTSSGSAAGSSAWKPLRVAVSFLTRSAGGLREIGSSRFLYLALVFSALVLIFQVLALWSIMNAYGFGLSFWAGAVVLIVVHLGTLIPNAPSNVGTYQFFCVVGLSMFGIDKTPATGFSVVAFVVLTVPLWILGLVALGRSGTSLHAIRSDISRLLKK